MRTQPTVGFGQTLPSPRRARLSAARIALRSTDAPSDESAKLRAPSVAICGDPPDEIPEILGLAEVAIDRREADVGDLVEAGQRLHHKAADHIARNVGLTRAFQLPDQRIDDALDPLGLHRPLAQGNVDRTGQFIPVERFALSVLFDDGQLAQLHALEGRKAGRAIRAETPASDRAAVVGWPRILDLGVIGSAKRTAHPLLPVLIG